jgi:outer membrane murein-binding lipoprotein Lpp
MGASLERVERKLDRILASTQHGGHLMSRIDDIDAKLSELNDQEDKVVALLDTIHAELLAAKDDPAKVQAVLDKIDARKAALAEAVVRDTDA